MKIGSNVFALERRGTKVLWHPFRMHVWPRKHNKIEFVSPWSPNRNETIFNTSLAKRPGVKKQQTAVKGRRKKRSMKSKETAVKKSPVNRLKKSTDKVLKREGGTTKASVTAENKHTKKEEAEVARRALTQYPLFEPPAAAYMFGKGVEGSFSPIMYSGQKNMEIIASDLGRSINLEEAKFLVHQDGEHLVQCALDGEPFQPMVYVAYPPRNLKELLKTRKLTDIPFVFGGSFYVKPDNTIIGVSGSVFCYTRQRNYQWSGRGALVTMALTMKETTGRMEWGVPMAKAVEIKKDRQAAEKRKLRAEELALEIAGKRARPETDVTHAWRKAQKNKRN